jgi:hypothetical protein
VELESRRITYAQAAEFYDRYEHLGSPGRGVYHWGAFADNVLVASVSFGTAGFGLHRGIFAQIATRHGLRVYQLTRGGTAPSAPKCTGSWIVSRGLRGIRELRGDCIVVAYSDTGFNEIGTIYQAANLLYLGKTDPKGQSDYVINRRRMSGWKVRRLFGTRDMRRLFLIDPQAVRQPLQPKHRYAYLAVGKRLRGEILIELSPLVRPYPKRDAEGVAPMNTLELVRGRGHGRAQAGGEVEWTPESLIPPTRLAHQRDGHEKT